MGGSVQARRPRPSRLGEAAPGRAWQRLRARTREARGGGERRPRAPAERGPRGPDQQVSLLPQRTAARPPRPLGSRLAGSTVRSHRVGSLFSPRPRCCLRNGVTAAFLLPPRGWEGAVGREFPAGWPRCVLPRPWPGQAARLSTRGPRTPLPARLSLEPSGCWSRRGARGRDVMDFRVQQGDGTT